MAEPLKTAGVLGLGSSLAGPHGPPEAQIAAALSRLQDVGIRLLRASRLWRSAAWPDPSEPPFLNAAALFESALPPQALLARLKELEVRFGRRPGPANGPRPLDLDLIDYGGRILSAPGLALPHPRAAERRFVMGPLCEIAPTWRHPAVGRSACELCGSATVGQDARPEAGAPFDVASEGRDPYLKGSPGPI